MASTTYQDDQKFGTWFFEDLVNYVADNLLPEKVYDHGVLVQWAEENGFVEEE
jgi:hypothetical protein